ncbi:MAG: hypothetical protein KH259_08715, partial [Haemophilus paraphrohaemolyticus]|uniref:hypothetical protein n=1 Tax=Haemophilus paraphrohaemolyticus TaxID=736 RepID=UPI001ED39FF6
SLDFDDSGISEAASCKYSKRFKFFIMISPKCGSGREIIIPEPYRSKKGTLSLALSFEERSSLTI